MKPDRRPKEKPAWGGGSFKQHSKQTLRRALTVRLGELHETRNLEDLAVIWFSQALEQPDAVPDLAFGIYRPEHGQIDVRQELIKTGETQ